MKKSSGQGRRGAKRRKNEEKRAKRVSEKVRRRAQERQERRRRIDVIKARAKKAIALSRVGIARRANDGATGLCARKDGLGRIDHSLKPPTFKLHYPWYEIYQVLLLSLERDGWVPLQPKSPLEHLADCSD